MLAIPLDKLAFIIVKARQYDAEVPTTDPAPGSNPADDGERAVLEEGPANPTLQELAGAIDSLSELERVELLALVWLGRGDYSRDEWREALREARRRHDEKETDYLIGTPLLGDYLQEGLAQLGYTIDDYEVGRL